MPLLACVLLFRTALASTNSFPREIALVERAGRSSYQHFLDLIKPLRMPTYVIPGNHDNPQLMSELFADTPHFPAFDSTSQFAIDDFPFRILALNSRTGGTELPEFSGRKLNWLAEQLKRSNKPTLVAIHHPPMKTGIELIDMGGSDWYQGLKSVLSAHDHVKLLICGHCHTDLCGRIGAVPVYMAAATAHQ